MRKPAEKESACQFRGCNTAGKRSRPLCVIGKKSPARSECVQVECCMQGNSLQGWVPAAPEYGLTALSVSLFDQVEDFLCTVDFILNFIEPALKVCCDDIQPGESIGIEFLLFAPAGEAQAESFGHRVGDVDH